MGEEEDEHDSPVEGQPEKVKKPKKVYCYISPKVSDRWQYNGWVLEPESPLLSSSSRSVPTYIQTYLHKSFNTWIIFYEVIIETL